MQTAEAADGGKAYDPGSTCAPDGPTPCGSGLAGLWVDERVRVGPIGDVADADLPSKQQLNYITGQLQHTLHEAIQSLMYAQLIRQRIIELSGSSADVAPIHPDYDLSFDGGARDEFDSLAPLSELSFTSWVKTSLRSPTVICSFADASGTNLLVLTTALRLEVNHEQQAASLSSVEPGVWHHVAFTWRSRGSYWATYLDGEPVRGDAEGIEMGSRWDRDEIPPRALLRTGRHRVGGFRGGHPRGMAARGRRARRE